MQQIKIGYDIWVFETLESGWVVVKYVVDGGLSRTQLTATDISSALQYVYSNYNGNIKPLRMDDLEELNRNNIKN